MSYRFDDVSTVRDSLSKVDYLADDGIAGVVYLADRLQKPVLIEGLRVRARPSSRSPSPR